MSKQKLSQSRSQLITFPSLNERKIGRSQLDLKEKAEIYPKVIYQNQQENQKVR